MQEQFLLELNVKSLNKTTKQLGSWKDINYFCQYVNVLYNNKDHPLIIFSIHLMINEIKEDIIKLTTNTNAQLSLAGKWAPREKSKFEWIFKKMACLYFPYFFHSHYGHSQPPTPSPLE